MKVRHPDYTHLETGEIISGPDENGKVIVKFPGAKSAIQFSLADLIVIPTATKFVLRGGDKIPVEELKKEQIDFVLSELQTWGTVGELVNKVSKHFSEYTEMDGAPLNQGGFDPMFVTTRKHPGLLIITGMLIYRKAAPRTGAQNEFKARAAATPEEIESARTEALARNKFVYEGK